MRIQLIPLLDFNSDEWHADETVVKIAGVKHYIWFIIDSETRFVSVFIFHPTEIRLKLFLCLVKLLSTEHLLLSFPTVIPLTKYLLNQFLMMLNIFVFKASKTIFQTT